MSSVVRPAGVRIVRSERAARNVRPLVENAEPVGEHCPEDYLRSASGLYAYELRHGTERHLGIVAEVDPTAFVDGQVRGHEAVQPARVDALVDHLRAAGARCGLVSLLHRPGPGHATALAAAAAGVPVTRFTGPDGWEQTVWTIPDPAGADLCAKLGRAVHYVADGHHRVAAGLRLWDEAGRPSGTGLLCVLHPLGGLRLEAFHRRLTGPVDPAQVRSMLAGAFEVHELTGPGEATDEIRVYLDGWWLGATVIGDRAAGAPGLDIAVLDRHVLGRVRQVNAAAAVEIAPTTTPLADLKDACDLDGGVLFVLRPPSMDQLTEVADLGEVMPPKTTYFAPKPYAGVFIR
ncbi:MAG: DUF1015 family protein [Nocardioides sp.]|nr:DUF1015 family protein [Nocardioides sp.]